MKIPKYRRRSIIPLRGSIPRGKRGTPKKSLAASTTQIIVVRDEELEAEIESYRKASQVKVEVYLNEKL